MNEQINFKDMVGLTVTSYMLSQDRETLTLVTDGPCNICLVTYGDCCSTTWIESLDNPCAIVGTIRSVENINMPDLGNIPTPHREVVDEVSYYGLHIATDKGTCVIDYRNDSNGYYGGDIEVYLARREYGVS